MEQYANSGPTAQWKYCDFTIPINGMSCCSNSRVDIRTLLAAVRFPVCASLDGDQTGSCIIMPGSMRRNVDGIVPGLRNGEGLFHPVRFFYRTTPEQPLEFAAELRRTFIAHLSARNRRRYVVSH